MKKNGHRLLTLAALVGTAAGVIHIANRFIDATSQLKDMLEQPHSKTYDWRFGKIFYTKQGHGTPILLIHDIMPGASGYEWNAIEKQLATEHTVYTIDLLGCGRSEKPDITYTNFVFAQLLCDFAKNVIEGNDITILSNGSPRLLPVVSQVLLRSWLTVTIPTISARSCWSIHQASVP